MFTQEQILNYHCPRFQEWPGIDLYMDQVVSLLSENVSLFYPDQKSNPVTSTMINNYVKQKIVVPSKKKRYQREHLADLYVVFLLKPAMELSDICSLLARLRSHPSHEEGYNLFCETIETALQYAFSNKDGSMPAVQESVLSQFLSPAASAFSYILLTRFELNK